MPIAVLALHAGNQGSDFLTCLELFMPFVPARYLLMPVSGVLVSPTARLGTFTGAGSLRSYLALKVCIGFGGTSLDHSSLGLLQGAVVTLL